MELGHDSHAWVRLHVLVDCIGRLRLRKSENDAKMRQNDAKVRQHDGCKDEPEWCDAKMRQHDGCKDEPEWCDAKMLSGSARCFVLGM